LTWLMNKIAVIFKSPLRDYVVATIVKVLTNRSGWILNKLNTILSPYWDLILRTANLDLVRFVHFTIGAMIVQYLNINFSRGLSNVFFP
jgi:hypothetical protein